MESTRVNAPELTKTDGENQPGVPAAVGRLAQCDVTTPSIDALADVDTHHKLMKFATQERGYIPPNRHLLDSRDSSNMLTGGGQTPPVKVKRSPLGGGPATENAHCTQI